MSPAAGVPAPCHYPACLARDRRTLCHALPPDAPVVFEDSTTLDLAVVRHRSLTSGASSRRCFSSRCRRARQQPTSSVAFGHATTPAAATCPGDLTLVYYNLLRILRPCGRCPCGSGALLWLEPFPLPAVTSCTHYLPAAHVPANPYPRSSLTTSPSRRHSSTSPAIRTSPSRPRCSGSALRALMYRV